MKLEYHLPYCRLPRRLFQVISGSEVQLQNEWIRLNFSQLNCLLRAIELYLYFTTRLTDVSNVRKASGVGVRDIKFASSAVGDCCKFHECRQVKCAYSPSCSPHSWREEGLTFDKLLYRFLSLIWPLPVSDNFLASLSAFILLVT